MRKLSLGAISVPSPWMATLPSNQLMNAPVVSGGAAANDHTGAPVRASRAYRCPSPEPK